MLVIMRLPETCSRKKQRQLEELLAKMRPSNSQGAWREVAHGGNNSEDGGMRQEVGSKRGLSLGNPCHIWPTMTSCFPLERTVLYFNTRVTWPGEVSLQT